MFLFITIATIGSITNEANAGTTIVAVVPTEIIVPPEDIGKTFQVNVTVTNVTDLYAWNINVSWNPSVLRFVGVPVEGPFLKQGGTTAFMYSKINNTAGYINGAGISCTLLGTVPGVNGNGTLLILTFNATAIGVSPIDISSPVSKDVPRKTVLVKSDRKTLIPHEDVDGSVTVIPEFSGPILTAVFLAITLLAVALAKKASSLKRRVTINAK